MGLRKPTQVLRATVSQEFREILAQEDGAPAGSYRKVQVLVPASPEVVFVLTPNEHWNLDADANVSRKLGANRVYKGSTFPADTIIPISVGPDQTLWAAAETGIGEVSLIVEFFER